MTQPGRYIGVDVGGTKVAVAVLEAGTLTEHDRRPTELGSPEALVDQLATMIAAAAVSIAGRKISPVRTTLVFKEPL